MAFGDKKDLDVVKEQPGSKQKLAPKDKKEAQEKPRKKTDVLNEQPGVKEQVAVEYKDKSGTGPETSLCHPAAQYDSYKRPRRDD